MLAVNVRALVTVALLSAMLAFSDPAPEPVKPFSVFHEGAEVPFAPEPSGPGHPVSLGPWMLGYPLAEAKPLDKRLNLYVTVPGKQYHSAIHPEYDHTLIINTLAEDKPREWDVYWCFILDPSFQTDLLNEHDLLMAAQETFHPADLFDVEDIPGRVLMAEKMDVHSLPDLRQYRRRDGTLPRILIIPARLALRATAAALETDQPGTAIRSLR
ncbi:MAG TPA: hypothetical protein VKT33_04380 [Candidatus Angelobacter sp.]|nr:hypothetical protein [Candidatus Angelobacter sp.]